jgi:hypothetical protein
MPASSGGRSMPSRRAGSRRIAGGVSERTPSGAHAVCVIPGSATLARIHRSVGCKRDRARAVGGGRCSTATGDTVTCVADQ